MAKRGGRKKRSGSTSTQPAAPSSPAAQETEGPSHRASKFVDGALPILQSAIKVASEAAGDATVSGLSIGLSALAEILEHVQTMKKTGEGVNTLQDRVGKLSKIVTDFCSRPQALPDETKRRIETLSQAWKDVATRTAHIASRGRVKRFLMAKSDAEELEGLLKEISDSIQEDFLIESLLSIEGAVAEANEGIREVRKDVRVIMGARLDDSFMAKYAKNAQYDASRVRIGCLEGTRAEPLQLLQDWIAVACSPNTITPTRSVHWVNGWAGAGKTTIAWSIAHWARQQGLLGGNFFFARDDQQCNDPDLFFTTISRQLCSYSAPFKEKVAAILLEDPTLIHAGVSRQFEELILRPLEEIGHDFPRCVIVVDALDECRDEDMTSTVLSIIAKFILRLAPFLVFVITSRPEPRITYLFSNNEEVPLKDATTPLLLHMIQLESVLDDIRRYFEKKFTEIRGTFKLMAKSWPSPRDLDRLVALSAGLFIWAATAVKFIADRTASNPKRQLKALLDIQTLSHTARQTSRTILDPLYSQIAQSAFSEISDTFAADLNPILGTIALAQEPVSVVALAGLIDIDPDAVMSALTGLSSVLHIPDDDNEPIRVIHPTFAEYLLQSSSSKPEAFIIDANAQHMRLFSRTLKVMDSLEPNIASFPTPSTFHSEVVDLDNTLKEKISAALSYSSRHWSAHLGYCGDTGNTTTMLNSLDNFFRTRALTWLEACSLLDALDNSVAALQTAQKACRDYGGLFAPLAEFISDCLRLTQAYYACLDVAPLQVHHSLLGLAPAASLLKQQYLREPRQSLLILRGAIPDWGPCIAAWSGHQGSWIQSVSFSADGAYFATGGADGYIRIWRTATRTSVKAIPAGDRGHQVAFSPSGTHVASAPGLRIWDVKTGDVVHTLHHDGVNMVVYSADGISLASGSHREIKLWDPLTGTCLEIIASVRARYINGMAISPDGTLVGGNDVEGHAVTYNTSSQVSEVLDWERRGYVAAFSPDGKYAASRAVNTVTVWALEDRSAVRTIEASSDVRSVAFSHSSSQIGCACEDGCVYIWTITSDDPPREFAGHTDSVNALAWSPDDTQVISVSFDGTIRVWDLTRHHSDTTLAASPPSSLPPLPGAPCYAVLRTPNTTALFCLPAPIQPSTAASDAAEDAPIITLYADMADAWDAILRGGRASGECAASRDWAFLTGRLHANMDTYWPAAVAPDGSLVAYTVPGYSGEVRVYNCQTGDHLQMTSGRMPPALSFAPDNTYLAIARPDSSALGLWDATSPSDSPLREITIEGWSRTIAYSRDGSILAAGTEDSDVHTYNTTTGQSITLLHGTRGTVTQITFSADDRHVIARAHPWSIVWDVATGDQILEFTPTHDHLLHSFDFAVDDTGIIIPDGKGETTKVTLWSPGDRIWPAYAVTEDGWLYAKSPGKVRRLCWLPPEWRTVFSMGGPRFCAPDAEQKRTVVFDVSRIPEYVEAWGEGSEVHEG